MFGLTENGRLRQRCTLKELRDNCAGVFGYSPQKCEVTPGYNRRVAISPTGWVSDKLKYNFSPSASWLRL